MPIYPIIRDLYGQLRGYRRWSIRREVARNMRLAPETLQAKTLMLRRERYLAAIRDFPAYAELVAAYTGLSDIATIPFEQLPVLTKSAIASILSPRPAPHSPPSALRPALSALRSLLSALCSPPSALRPPLYAHSTGGSTGQPFRFYITRESYEWRTAVSDRGYSWAQAEEGQRSFYVWGTAINKPGWKQQFKAGIHHWLQKRRYFDSFRFDDEQKAECCRRINRFKPVSLVGYAGNLIELARFVSRNPGVLTWRAKTVVTAAEGLRPGMRTLIESHLADEVFMSYGSREFMLIGMECERHCGYHIASDNLYVEVVDDEGRPCPPGVAGRIVVTDLHNDATPFVRYAIGDVGTTESTEWRGGKGQESAVCGLRSAVCSCGLPFPLLQSVDGRLQEVIVKANGETLTALFIPHLMKEFGWVDGYQVVQESPGKLTMNLVTQEKAWSQRTAAIKVCLAKKTGEDLDIQFIKVEALEKTASGKTPIVLSRI